MQKLFYIGILFLFLWGCSPRFKFGKNEERIWTFTYIKSVDNQKIKLKKYLEKNWFAMDSIAVKQKLIAQYELYENKSTDSLAKWDYIVAVEYFNTKGYEGIAEKFEEIRKKHKTVKIEELGFKELGKVVGSETITKKMYSRKKS
jgi:hypothetical protein